MYMPYYAICTSIYVYLSPSDRTLGAPGPGALAVSNVLEPSAGMFAQRDAAQGDSGYLVASWVLSEVSLMILGMHHG